MDLLYQQPHVANMDMEEGQLIVLVNDCVSFDVSEEETLVDKMRLY